MENEILVSIRLGEFLLAEEVSVWQKGLCSAKLDIDEPFFLDSCNDTF
jgi:hypothetical protein